MYIRAHIYLNIFLDRYLRICSILTWIDNGYAIASHCSYSRSHHPHHPHSHRIYIVLYHSFF